MNLIGVMNSQVRPPILMLSEKPRIECCNFPRFVLNPKLLYGSYFTTLLYMFGVLIYFLSVFLNNFFQANFGSRIVHNRFMTKPMRSQIVNRFSSTGSCQASIILWYFRYYRQGRLLNQ